MADPKYKLMIPIWAVAVAIIATIVLMKFCNGGKPVKKIDTAVIEKQHIEDSIAMDRERIRHQNEVDSLKSVFQQKEFDYIIASMRIDNVVQENKSLIAKHKARPPVNVGAGITTVPQEFIDDCEGCFTQLIKTNDSAVAYKQEAEALRAVMAAQNEADSQRIAQLEQDKLRLNKHYNDMRIAAEVNAKYLEPRRKVKTGLAGTFSDSFLPNGVGVGLMYEDKKDRNFGVEALFGNRPPLYVARVYVPFTLLN